jgi:hypothetical protein
VRIHGSPAPGAAFLSTPKADLPSSCGQVKAFFPQMIRQKFFYGFIVSLLALNAAHATTVTNAASADTWMLAEASGNNMGASADFAAGVNSHGSPMRALIKFDLTGIPAGATITSAAVKIETYRAATSSATSFGLHRVLVNWGEGAGDGNQGAPAGTGDATWDSPTSPFPNWTSAGAGDPADANTTPSASTSVTGLGVYTWGSTASMVADVQAWVNNSAVNYGWLLRDEAEAGQTARRWNSKNADGDVGPKLIVSYTILPPPPVISQVGVINNQIRFVFGAEADRTYSVEWRGSLTSGSWLVASNYPSLGVATNRIFTETLTSTNRFYRITTP